MTGQMTFKTTRKRRPYFAARLVQLGPKRKDNVQRLLGTVCTDGGDLDAQSMLLFASVRDAA